MLLTTPSPSPTGTGKGGSSIFGMLYGEQGRFFEDEIRAHLRHNKSGLLCMANAGANLNSSQFCFTMRGEEMEVPLPLVVVLVAIYAIVVPLLLNSIVLLLIVVVVVVMILCQSLAIVGHCRFVAAAVGSSKTTVLESLSNLNYHYYHYIIIIIFLMTLFVCAVFG